MPIYEYECKSCHHQFDLMQKINEPAVKQCPLCLEETAVRLISAAGFQLKGNGWYATDFKNNTKPESKKDKTETPSETKASGDNKPSTPPPPTPAKKGEKE
ncbi:MAG: zinc ribbon domain-containing protein [Tatlockia sp.]|nr:zinc ribbon domain-containing protein [Tatlockia sp.]